MSTFWCLTAASGHLEIGHVLFLFFDHTMCMSRRRRYVDHFRDVQEFIRWVFSFCFLANRLLSVLRGHSFFSFPPQRPMTSDFEGFLYQILSITLFSYLNSWERASISHFQCWVLNKGNTGTIFITSLVWRAPWTVDWTRDLIRWV